MFRINKGNKSNVRIVIYDVRYLMENISNSDVK